MQTDLLLEARRQAEICNACRYCEGYCSVFPALHRDREFTEPNLIQLANLCHNCRNCYYACQFTAPHEFDLNLPRVLADLRQDSWQQFAWPRPLARIFHRSGVALMAGCVLGIAAIFFAIRTLGAAGGEGFYAVLSHNAMVAIFLPAFLFPFLSLGVSLRRYWQATGGGTVPLSKGLEGLDSAVRLKNLAGGHGEGCNFEAEDRFSHARRLAHQAVLVGFILCFLSTSSATVMHYLLDWPAPYGPFSVPKILGVPGGLLMSIGALWLAFLKLRADRDLGAETVWGGEMAFTLLVFFVAFSGLVLYAVGNTPAMPALLAIHLGAVLSFFLLTPYTKMAHGFYRIAALLRAANH